MDNVEVFVEDLPAARTSPASSACTTACRSSKRGTHYAGALPDHITLYRGTIERIARGDDERCGA